MCKVTKKNSHVKNSIVFLPLLHTKKWPLEQESLKIGLQFESMKCDLKNITFLRLYKKPPCKFIHLIFVKTKQISADISTLFTY